MRLIALLLIANVAYADDNAILDAAKKAGYSSPRVLAKGAFYVIADGPTDDFDGKIENKLLAIGAQGSTPIVELAVVEHVIGSAKLSPFLARKDYFDVTYVIEGNPPLDFAKSKHVIVRAGTLEAACEIAGDHDSHGNLKAQRSIQTVTFTKLKADPFTFKVTTKNRGNVQGTPIKKDSAQTYELGKTGSCVKK